MVAGTLSVLAISTFLGEIRHTKGDGVKPFLSVGVFMYGSDGAMKKRRA